MTLLTSQRPFPTTTDYVAAWICANYEKDDYLDFLTSKSSIRVRHIASPAETRSYLKVNCILFSASLWPAEVLRYLINWHKRMLDEVPKPEGTLAFCFLFSVRVFCATVTSFL